MGYNSTVLILNDMMGRIESDPKLWAEELLFVLRGGKPGPFSCQSAVITTNHSSETSVIAVGGNCASVLGRFHGFNHSSLEGQIELLRQLAERFGFRRLIKKRNIKISKLLRAALGQFEGTSEWWCTNCSRRHKPTDYNCMCGQIKPDGKEYIPALLNALADVYGIKLDYQNDYECDGDRVVSSSLKTKKRKGSKKV